MNGIPMAGAELVTTIMLPKAMNIYEYEHWEMTEEGDDYLRARFALCDEIAAEMDKKKEEEEANAENRD